MDTKSYNIVRKIRLKRELSLSNFSSMLGISLSYLCLVEKGDRKLSKEMAEKIIKALPDITKKEKLSLEKAIFFNSKEMQKYIMALIADFFYKINNGLTSDMTSLVNKIVGAIKKLERKDVTNEMVIFAEV